MFRECNIFDPHINPLLKVIYTYTELAFTHDVVKKVGTKANYE